MSAIANQRPEICGRQPAIATALTGYLNFYLALRLVGFSTLRTDLLMRVPQVVIVGRPNVGKSSIFNWLAKRRLAIVDDTQGVTRDRLIYFMVHRSRCFELVDTGGIGVDDPDNLTSKDRRANRNRDRVGRPAACSWSTRATGLVPLDEEVARRLRYTDKPVILVANKSDESTFDPQADEFHKLRRGKLLCVSTLQNRNRQVCCST